MESLLTDDRLQSGSLPVINGRYQIIRELGRGQQAVVLLVEDTTDATRHALKIVRQPASQVVDGEYIHLSRLRHRGLVRIDDVGQLQHTLVLGDDTLVQGASFLSMQWVAGSSAHTFLAAIPERDRNSALLDILDDLASVLDYLHRNGLRHHDLKPENILIDEAGRAVLIDFGLALDAGQTTARGARGTIAYCAPEALGGEGDHRVDLYGLGTTAWHLATGRPPFAANNLPELVRSVVEDPPAGSQPQWVDDRCWALLERLVRKDPAWRPSSACEVLCEIARQRGDLQRVATLSARRPIVAPGFVGRAGELRRLTERLRALSAGDSCPLVLEICGEPGVGKTALVRAAIRRHRIAGLTEPSLSLTILEQLPAAAGGPCCDLSLEDQALQCVESLSTQRQAVIHVASIDPLVERVLSILAAADQVPDGVLIVVESDRPVRPSGTASSRWEVLEIGGLQRAEADALVASMLGAPAEQAGARQLHRLSAGNPLLLTELATQQVLGAEGHLDEQVPSLGQLLERRRLLLSGEKQQLLDGLAVWGAASSVTNLAELLEDSHTECWELLSQLATTGIVALEGEWVDFISATHRRAWSSIVEPATAARYHRRAATVLEGDREADPQRVRHLLLAGDASALELAEQNIEALRTAGEIQGALDLAELSLALDPNGVALDRIRLLAVRLNTETGRYARALEIIEDVPAPRRNSVLSLALARVQQLLGDDERAEETLQRLLERLEADSPHRTDALGIFARLLVRRGDFKAALTIAAQEVEQLTTAERSEGEPLTDGMLELIEAVGLARFYRGDLDGAEALFAWAGRALTGSSRVRVMARFANMQGMVAYTAGRLNEAVARYRRALELARQASDRHGVANYTGCVGSTLVDLGRYGEALTHMMDSVTGLGRFGRTAELVAALCNLGDLLLLLGDHEQAAEVMRRGLRLSGEGPGRRWRGVLERLQGDIAWRGDGDLQRAIASYERAATRLRELGDERQLLWVELRLAEALVGAGRWADADRLLKAVAEQIEIQDELEQGGYAMARARWILAAPDAKKDFTFVDEVASKLVAHCERLERRGALGELWRAAALLGRLRWPARQAGPVLVRARQVLEEVMKQVPEVYREAIGSDPDATTLLSNQVQNQAAAPPQISGEAETLRLRRLLAINKRLNSELDLDRLLELIIDNVIELTDAERGFLVLADQDEALEIKVARNFDRRSIDGEELELSRSIAERAARTGEPVVTVDAADDGRFAGALSVSNLRLRSVLAVPLAVKGRAVGTIYVDHRLRRGVFNADDVALMQDFADQAAIAIDNARLLAENSRRSAEIEELNKQLSSTVATQQAELAEAREELRASRERLRYDYDNIVGRSPKMLELLQLLDRVTQTELPVVIQGASGTGKELVARAIHHNGARSARPFVSENCGAVPETLLESVLFGHVRGAFTGADRDRKGLFEIASGGTLFLDEVGEMSPAMQTKLLRVLQDGELRRVGGERAIQTDVRVIAASNADLRKMVEQGTFREDLFFRLNVVQVTIPSLAERRDDIPLLVGHFLEKHGASDRRVAPETMALLVGYRWPGNVRELENEIMRMAALAGEVVLPEDLSPHIRGTTPLTMGSDEQALALKPRVEHLERELIKQALSKTGGNQSQAARLLGLSRYGLLKKIRRFFPEQCQQS